MTIFISTRVLILLIYLSKNGAAVRFCSMRKHKSAFLSFENCINKFKSLKKTQNFPRWIFVYLALGLKEPDLHGKLPNRTAKYAQNSTSPASKTLATVTQAMFRGSSRNVTWRSVVVVGAAVVDSGMRIDTVAVSARKRTLNDQWVQNLLPKHVISEVTAAFVLTNLTYYVWIFNVIDYTFLQAKYSLPFV